ncbi:DUF4898 domain-containing protein [Stygiolobus caldivivus]|uniref:Uncharacterized protein n=1 Tax=Stygiolobus caldivivus TaxID=2824673 RepID=A0A8D5ZK63_9CREN|nr:DUF4898 domain-containing protein [Stygiolobus caldivivus]BCU71055.1 hypothetical protein KN1_23520 [Stygiolobus caldivivus]
MSVRIDEFIDILRIVGINKSKLIVKQFSKTLISDYSKFFRLVLSSIPLKSIIFIVPSCEDAEKITRAVNEIFPDREIFTFINQDNNTNQVLLIVQIGEGSEPTKELERCEE